ncbi:MAG TPA: hypothetical protein VFX33_09080 [Actinomycetales bacterium]|nr:hypothetical protein [Actinomycetales bacterium]
MSREVLGSPGTEPDAGPQLSHARAVTIVTDLDAPDVPTQTLQPTQSSRRAQPGQPALPTQNQSPADEPAPGEVTPAATTHTTAGPPSEPGAPSRWPLGGWRRHIGLIAAFAVGAAVAGLITGSVLEKHQAEERMAAVRLLAGMDMQPQTGQDGRLAIQVLNIGQDPVTLEDAMFTGNEGNWGMKLEETAEVLPGRSATVPTHVRLDCGSAPPQGLDLRVRTQDGTLRTVAALTAPYAGNGVDIVQYLCHTNPDGIEIWSTRARDDGTLSLQIRNPGDNDIDLEIRGPAGTRIVTDPPSPVHLPARSGMNLNLTVDVERCTSAAQRAAAGDDLRMQVNGEDVGGLPTDPTVLSGWVARSVALACR